MATKKQTSKTEEKKEKKVDSLSDIRVQITKAREELTQLRLDHSMRKVKNTSSLTHKRKEIARMLTQLRAAEGVK